MGPRIDDLLSEVVSLRVYWVKMFISRMDKWPQKTGGDFWHKGASIKPTTFRVSCKLLYVNTTNPSAFDKLRFIFCVISGRSLSYSNQGKSS